ncbi:hypothetical protein ES703_119940 [subsurface metagenome]
MGQAVIAQRSTLAILEPLLGNLVTADVKIPDSRRHTFKVLFLVDVYPSCVFIIAYFIHHIGARHRICGDEATEYG